MSVRGKRKSPYIISVIVVLGFLATLLVQRTIDTQRRETQWEYFFIPQGKVLKTFTFGFDHFLGDIYWLRCIQYAAEKRYTRNGLTWMFRSLDLVTTLDRRFKTAYLFGGIILASDGKFVDQSITLLKKGMENLSDEWRFPFHIGFNYFFYLQDFDSAARYIMRASRIRGAPSYLPLLASRLLSEAKKPETAIAFLEKMYREADDPVLKEKIFKRIKRVLVERDLIFLEKGVKKYRGIFGSNPEGLQDMVKEGLIRGVPREPFGGYYYLDRQSKVPRSSTVRERLKLYKPGK